METVEITLAERGQIVIPKEARDELGLKPGSRLQVRVENGRLLIEKRVRLDLVRWIGKGVDDGLTTAQALAGLRDRPVPWNSEAAGQAGETAASASTKTSTKTPAKKSASRKPVAASKAARQP